MKTRVFTFLSALLIFGGSLSAAPVSSSRALDIAKKIFAAQPATKAVGGSLRIVWDGEEVATKAAAQPAFYVIARDGGGFVIIAGDDNVMPVLAISDRSEFKVEGMPDNVKWWMDRMKAYVRATTGQTLEVGEAWAAFTTTKSGLIPGGVTVTNEILTPEWGQGLIYKEQIIYNSKCPIVQGKNTITGCVATAIGEVMTTLSGIYTSAMPASGSGTIEPYSLPSGYDPAVYTTAATEGHPYVLSANYDWANLRTLKDTATIKRTVERGSGADLALIENMNQLLADVGAVMHACYSIDDTGAYTEQTPDFIATYFGFNKVAYFDLAANYSARQWREKLKEQLAVRPIVYSGRTQDNKFGHAFVFDGYGTYQGNDVFHVNFGWNGWCNGYYYETNLDTPRGYNFSWKCGAVFDFYPAPESVYPKIIQMDAPGMAYVFGDEDSGFKPVPSLGEGGDRFTLLGWFWNAGHELYSGASKLVLKDKAGKIKAEGEPRSVSLDSGYGWPTMDFSDIKFDVSYAFGDYLEIYSSTDDDPAKWERIHIGGNPSQIVSALPIYPVAFIRTEDSYKVGDWFEFALMNHDQIYAGTRWTFTDPDGKAVTIDQSEWEFQLTKKGLWIIEAAVAPEVGAAPVKTITAYISVSE